MAPTRTTTLRVPVTLRDEIAALAEARGSTMLEVVTEAVDRLSRDEWWDDVRSALDGMDDESRRGYARASSSLDGAIADGLGDG